MTQVDEGTLSLSLFEMREDHPLIISDANVPFEVRSLMMVVWMERTPVCQVPYGISFSLKA